MNKTQTCQKTPYEFSLNMFVLHFLGSRKNKKKLYFHFLFNLILFQFSNLFKISFDEINIEN